MNPFRKVNPGEPLKIAAQTWNAVVDEVATRPRFDAGGSAWPPINFSVRCRNDSGANVARWSVLQIDGVLEDPTGTFTQFERAPGVIGVSPGGPTESASYVVVLDPIEAGAIGMAAVAGAVQCRVNVRCTGHQYAVPANGVAAYMDTTDSGPFKILWRGTTGPAAATGVTGATGPTGPRATGPWAIVMFGTDRPLESFPNYSTGATQLLGHAKAASGASGATGSSGCDLGLQWYSVTECAGNPSYATSYFL